MKFSFFPLGFPWQTQDPYLFCVFHQDFFPSSNGQLAPSTSLAGRQLGNDFVIKDGFRMYHGNPIPGFPAHPHRGFETLTVVPQGIVDHADSLGGRGRYGEGDVQWMTAGAGVQHSEMFPLLNKDQDNPMVLFQIWLNLPAKSKMVTPDYKMSWEHQIPKHQDSEVKVTYFVGDPKGKLKSRIPDNSWASEKQTHVAVWQIEIEPQGSFELPQVPEGVNRSLYCYEGHGGQIQSSTSELTEFRMNQGTFINTPESLKLSAQNEGVKFLLLQAKPIEEPVVQYGPFVMNTEEEIHQAYSDYQRTQFGGWPWPKSDQTHGEEQRFAEYPDGRKEIP